MRVSTNVDTNNNRVSDYLLVAIAPLCWAGDVVLARSATGIIPPHSLVFWRWLVAFLILLPFGLEYVKKDWEVARKEWKMILLLSSLGVSVFITLIYLSVQSTTAINVALIQTLMPAAIAINCFMLYREKITLTQSLCLLSCFLGVCLVLLKGSLANFRYMTFALGDMLMVVATLMYGLYSALLQRRAPKLHPVSMLTLFSGAGALVLLPVYLLEVVYKGGFEITLSTIGRISYAAIFPSIIAYFCWIRGVSTIGANKTGSFINLLPVFASILAVIFLGEVFKWYHFVGMTLVVAGMLAFNSQKLQTLEEK